MMRRKGSTGRRGGSYVNQRIKEVWDLEIFNASI
jgi:hypothetical protein